MNIVFGLNEAGKSSWHAAIFAGLCGMSRGRGRKSSDDVVFTDRHKPWSGDDWTVTTVVELDDGRTIELFQDLDDLSNCHAIDLVTGKDVTHTILTEQTPDGARFLGLNRRTLPPTLLVRQAEMLKVLEDPDELQEQLQRAAATAGADETAEAAIDRIKEFHKERVGTARAKTKPLESTRARISVASDALRKAKEHHDEYLGLVEQLTEAEGQADQAERERQDLSQELGRRRREALRDRIKRAKKLQSLIPEGPLPDVAEIRDSRDRILGVLSRFDNRPVEPAILEGQTVVEIEEILAVLPEPPQGDVEPAEDVVQAERDWRRAKTSLEAHEVNLPSSVSAPDTGGMSSSALREFADALGRELPTVDQNLERRLAEITEAEPAVRSNASNLMLAAGVVLATAGAVLVVMGFTIPGIIALGMGVLLVVLGFSSRRDRRTESREVVELEVRLATQQERLSQAHREQEAVLERVSTAGLPGDPLKLRELAASLEDAASQERTIKGWKSRNLELREDESKRAERFRRALIGRLDDYDLQAGPDADVETEQLLLRYKKECQERRSQAREADRRPGLEHTLTARKSAEKAASDDMEQRKLAEKEVRQAAADAGVVGDEIEAIVDALRVHVKELGDRIEEIDRQGKHRAALREILGDKTLPDLEAELARLEGIVDLTAGAEARSESQAELEDLLKVATDRSTDALELKNKLAGRTRSYDGASLDVAFREEALENLQEELTRLETLGDTLTRTRQFLEVARDRVQMEFAPRLKQSIEGRLSQVTGGRYHEATVAPDTLEVKVRPKDGQWTSAGLLSHGTAEQVYLLLRVALVEHMVKDGEQAPLFLDDVTVQSDVHRTEAVLDLLYEISQERQIVFFSQEEEVLAWAKRELRGSQDSLIELEEPAAT